MDGNLPESQTRKKIAQILRFYTLADRWQYSFEAARQTKLDFKLFLSFDMV